MAELNFNALHFDSQQIPGTLPAQPLQTSDGVALTAEQETMLGLNSTYAGLGLLDTPEKVLRHCELLAQDRAARAAADAAERAKLERTDPVLRAQRADRVAAHQTVVTAANLAWRNAIKERKRIIDEQNAEVERLHAEFTRLKNLKVE